MSKLTLTNLVNLQNETAAVTAINNNNAAIITAMDNTLSRDGTLPNTMTATLDMNSHPIINLPAPVTNFEPLRVIDRTTLNGGGTVTVSPLPTGGTSGQYLAKNSSTNFDVSWYTPSSGGTTSSTFDTLALAQAGILPLSITNITITRKQAGWPLANAPYVRGTISGPNAFQDALGNYWQVDTSNAILHATWFWAGGGGDDTAPLQAACNASSGKTLLLDNLAYNVSNSVSIPSHFNLYGAGYQNCSITVSGVSEVRGILQGYNKGWVNIEGISFIGNNIAAFAQSAGAIAFGMDIDGVADAGFVNIRRCYFANFKQNFWVDITNGGITPYSLGIVTVSDNVFSSVLGNSRTYNDENDCTYMIRVWGNTVSPTSTIAGVVIQRNKAYAIGVVGFSQVWQNTGNFLVTDNDVEECGFYVSGLPNVYVFLFYSGIQPYAKSGIFSRNRLFNTISSGFYVGCGAGVYIASVTGSVIVTDNSIEGFTRTDSGTLRRGGIVLNGIGRSITSGNILSNNATGIAIFGPADQLIYESVSLHVISDNVISSGVGGATGIDASNTNSGVITTYTALLNNLITTSGAVTVKNPGTFGTIYEAGTKP